MVAPSTLTEDFEKRVLAAISSNEDPETLVQTAKTRLIGESPEFRIGEGIVHSFKVL
jgi:hypothetical protein